MQFLVHRTSGGWRFASDSPPCPGAYPVGEADKWGKFEYAVNINTIEELIAFTKRHGLIVFGPKFMGDERISIEIYDGYRE